MINVSLLELLKFIGFAVTAASTIWGLAKKTSFEDENGNRRLTAAGQVSIAFAVAGFMVGAGAYGLELSLSATKAAEARIEKADRDAVVREQRNANLADADRDQRLALQQALDAFTIKSRADQIRAAQILDSLRAVEAERAARLRDIRLAGQVREGTRSNLARAETALSQLDRLMNPLGEFSFDLVWEIPVKTPESRAAIANFAEAATNLLRARRGLGAAPLPPGCRPGVTGEGHSNFAVINEGSEGVVVRPGCSVFPRPEQNHALFRSIPIRGGVVFDGDRIPEETMSEVMFRDSIGVLYPHQRLGGITFSLTWSPEVLEFVYFPDEHKLVMTTTVSGLIPPQRGKIPSLQDLERAKIYVWFLERLDFTGETRGISEIIAGSRLRSVRFNVENRSYLLSRSELRPIQKWLYTADAVGPPEECQRPWPYC